MSETMLIPKADLQAACNAIREKDGSAELILSGQLADKIRALPSGGIDLDGWLRGDATDIDVVSNVTTLRAGAFCDTKIRSCSLPEVVSIGEMYFLSNPIFCNTPNLTSVYAPKLKTINGTGEMFWKSNLSELSLPALELVHCEGLLQIFQFSNLKNISLPSYVGDLGIYSDYRFQKMFAFCEKLQSVYIPMIEDISVEMFQNCYALKTFDTKAKHICKRAFWQSGITTLILRSPQVVSLDSDAFDITPIADGTGFIYVPRALVDQYKAAVNWSTYANQIRAIEDYPEICGPTA